MLGEAEPTIDFVHADCLQVSRKTIGAEGYGWVLLNPPYDRRIAADRGRLYRELAGWLAGSWGGASALVLVPAGSEGAFGGFARLAEDRSFDHAGTRVSALLLSVSGRG